MPPTTAEEKAQKRLEVKARSTLMIGIPNEHYTNEAVSSAQAVNTANGVSTPNLKAPKNQDYKNKESTRRTMPVETSTSTALVSCDGLGGYDWSDQAEEGPNYALMAYSYPSSNSEVSNNSNCSKSCLKTVETLKSQYDQLYKDFKKSKLMVLAYKSGLESVEEKLEVYKANESIYSQDIKVLKFEIKCKDIAIRELRKKLEIAQKEKDGIQFNVDKFENASKSLNKLIESQIIDNCKKGLGYNAVPPPYTGNFMPPTPDLSFTSLDEFVNKTIVENRKSDEEVSKVVRKSNNSPIIKDWVSDSEEENVSQTKTEKKIVKPSIAKIEFVKPKQQEKTVRKTIKQVEKNRQNTHSPRGNQRNWNNMMSQRLGSNFEMFNKACYMCGSFDHLQRDNTVKDKNVNAARPKAVVNDARPKAVVNVVQGNNVNVVKASTCWVWKPKTKVLDHVSKYNSASITLKKFDYGNPQMDLQDKGVIDSRCSRHMTGNMSYLTDYEEIDGGYVAFGGNPKGGKITGKGTIKTGNLDFENVYFMRELKFNLFSVSQMCDKKNSVLFNDTECIVLSSNFKLIDESQVLLRVPRKNNMYSVDLKNIVPKRGLTCLFAKATSNESKLWHRRLDDYSRFTWVFFLATKDETSGILKSFITGIENLVDHKVKVIRCDNGTEFKNREMNLTLIEAARTMLADSKLPTTFWAEAVNTACYKQNRVLVVKPHNKTPYELFHGRTPTLTFMKPFGCPVTILNTIDHLGKFDGKADEGFFVGYSLNSKASRVFNSRTRIVEENLHIRFSENTPNSEGSRPDWLFDIDALTRTMNYDALTNKIKKKWVKVQKCQLIPITHCNTPIFTYSSGS
ncbi:putative ribonuclease H-like domain-containing protein [Tanacetum coccineum]